MKKVLSILVLGNKTFSLASSSLNQPSTQIFSSSEAVSDIYLKRTASSGSLLIICLFSFSILYIRQNYRYSTLNSYSTFFKKSN